MRSALKSWLSRSNRESWEVCLRGETCDWLWLAITAFKVEYCSFSMTVGTEGGCLALLLHTCFRWPTFLHCRYLVWWNLQILARVLRGATTKIALLECVQIRLTRFCRSNVSMLLQPFSHFDCRSSVSIPCTMSNAVVMVSLASGSSRFWQAASHIPTTNLLCKGTL